MLLLRMNLKTVNKIMKYSMSWFLIGVVLLTNSTHGDSSISSPKVSPLDNVQSRYQSGYYTETRRKAIESYSYDKSAQDVRVKQLLFSRLRLLEAEQQIQADTERHADIIRMLAYTENELMILGIQPSEYVNRIMRADAVD